MVGAEVCCCSLSDWRGLFKKLISTSSLLFLCLLLPFRVLGEDPSAGGPERGLIRGGAPGGTMPSPKLLRLLGTLDEV